MKSILILFFFVSTACFSQELTFNFEKSKAYKITMTGADNFKKTDHIERLMEKMFVSQISFVDSTTGIGYFIIDDLYKAHEIEKLINNESDIHFKSGEEVQLTEDLFLEIYIKRGRNVPLEFSAQPPKKVFIGPFVKLTNDLYNKANEIWEKKYKH